MPRPEPEVSRLKYASQAIQIRSQYLHPGDCRPFKVIQGNTTTPSYDKSWSWKIFFVLSNPGGWGFGK